MERHDEEKEATVGLSYLKAGGDRAACISEAESGVAEQHKTETSWPAGVSRPRTP